MKRLICYLHSYSPELNTESKFSVNSVNEFGRNDSNSINFFKNSYSSQVRKYENLFILAKSECFSLNLVTELVLNFNAVFNSGELLY